MKRPAFDPDGNYLAMVTDDYAATALRRGECVVSEDGHLVIVPQPINELSPEVKRRIQLAKERAKR